LTQGLCVTVNSDDPAYFGGYLLENFFAVQRGLDLSRAEVRMLAENSFEAAFLPSATKDLWLRRIAAYDAHSTLG
jgi:adenosine deaminase